MSKMEQAYRAAWKLMKAKMEKERPEDLETLEDVKKTDVVIVRGSYDFIERVFESFGLPFTLIETNQLEEYPLQLHQTLMINLSGLYPLLKIPIS